MQRVVVGRLVHYQWGVAQENGDDGIRPAIITKVWNANGMVNLAVFLDGSYDSGILTGCPACAGRGEFNGFRTAIAQRTSVEYALTDKVGCWHWPPGA